MPDKSKESCKTYRLHTASSRFAEPLKTTRQLSLVDPALRAQTLRTIDKVEDHRFSVVTIKKEGYFLHIISVRVFPDSREFIIQRK